MLGVKEFDATIPDFLQACRVVPPQMVGDRAWEEVVKGAWPTSATKGIAVGKGRGGGVSKGRFNPPARQNMPANKTPMTSTNTVQSKANLNQQVRN